MNTKLNVDVIGGKRWSADVLNREKTRPGKTVGTWQKTNLGEQSVYVCVFLTGPHQRRGPGWTVSLAVLGLDQAVTIGFIFRKNLPHLS